MHRHRLAACWCQSMALKMAAVRWDGRWRSLPPTPLAAWRVGTGSRADNVPWSPGPGSCPRTCCTPCTLPWAMYMPDHMRRRPSERLLRRRPRQSRPSATCSTEVRGEVEVMRGLGPRHSTHPTHITKRSWCPVVPPTRFFRPENVINWETPS